MSAPQTVSPLAERIRRANQQAMDSLCAASPVWVDVCPALDVLPGMRSNTILHAGPPIAWEEMCGPQQMGVLHAVIHEGLAHDEAGAMSLLRAGGIVLAPCHEYDAVGGMAGITSASSPMAVVLNRHSGNYGYSQLFQGPAGGLQSRDHYHREARRQWHWLATVLGPALKAAVRHLGGLEVKPLIARALEMGDECHNRNSAGSGLLLKALAPALFATSDSPQRLRESLDYLTWADQFSLCISMASAKATADAARNIPFSTVVTTMARNGVDFGIKVSGLGEQWFTAPANRVDGLYFSSDYSDADAVADMGDSAIMEVVGLGGHAQAAAPALQQFVGGSFARAVGLTQEMGQITLGVMPEYRIPNIDFAGAPLGTDIRLVVQTGITPVIDTAIAHHKGGVIGAGQTRAPLACFTAALRAFHQQYA
jgi:hypothetical protein